MGRVVVIGHGMAGARVVTELSRRQPGLRITVLGAEHQEAYNRTLLTDLLVGTVSTAEIRLAEERGFAQVCSGVSALAIDRERRTVKGSDGSVHPYDVLVLATGGTPRLPPVQGLLSDEGALAPGIAVFHTFEDCQRILRLARNGSRALVLGGGLLGLETARALAMRGLGVEVINASPVVMERQLDAEASAMLVSQLGRLDVTVRLGCTVASVTGKGRLAGVCLDDGQRIPCDLLVVSCGFRPAVTLAESANLPVGAGVIVDDTMRTADPAIYAIGDCAEVRGVVHGLVGEAWEHARIAAEAIAGAADRAGSAPGAPAPPAPTRLKADGVELTVMGESNASEDPAGAGPDVLTFTDVAHGLHRRIVLRGGRITGATVLGGGDLDASRIVERYQAGSLVTAAEAYRLLQPNAEPDEDIEEGTGPDPNAAVCYCNDVPRKRIMEARAEGAVTVAAIARRTKATTGCGICRSKVKALLESVGASTAE